MFIIYVINSSNKNKMRERGFIFLKNQKYILLEIENRVILFQKFLIFHICLFKKIINVTPEHSFDITSI